MQISSFTITYTRRTNLGDYNHTESTINIGFIVDENEDTVEQVILSQKLTALIVTLQAAKDAKNLIAIEKVSAEIEKIKHSFNKTNNQSTNQK